MSDDYKVTLKTDLAARVAEMFLSGAPRTKDKRTRFLRVPGAEGKTAEFGPFLELGPSDIHAEDLPEADYAALHNSCELIGLLTITSQYYPDQKRGEYCKALAGVLLRRGVSPKLTQQAIQHIACIAGDPGRKVEPSKREYEPYEMTDSFPVGKLRAVSRTAPKMSPTGAETGRR